MASDLVKHVTDATFEADVLQSVQPILVDYWAEWCGPCKMIAPILDEVSVAYEGKLQIAKMNVDENREIPAKFGIRGIPTLMLFKDGKLAATKVGAIVMAALLVMYIVLLANTGVQLLMVDSALAKIMGLLILAFPAFGLWAIIQEFIFGTRVEALERKVQQEGVWPEMNFETRPSGRPIRASADAVFEQFRQAASERPEDWHSWFNLGLAYSAAGDRRRARAAMRKAIALAPKN